MQTGLRRQNDKGTDEIRDKQKMSLNVIWKLF